MPWRWNRSLRGDEAATKVRMQSRTGGIEQAIRRRRRTEDKDLSFFNHFLNLAQFV
jgi:hypothetical protein